MSEHKNPGVNDVMNSAKTYIHSPESLALIEKAANYATEHHAGQFRKSGEPYIIHLTNVAYILTTLQAGPKTIAAGFLHDVIEDCGVSHDQLAADFDEEIADLVEAVTKVGTLEYKGKEDPEYQAANHRKIFIAMAKDVRVILIKLCDRLHNMRTLQYQSAAAQKRIAAETLDVYAPIAHRLGISSIKNELEDLSFYYLNREEYHHIASLVEEKKTERDASVAKMIQEITVMLKEKHLQFRIFGRSKHLYSIYNKMIKRHKRFDQIMDLLAIRIITDTELHCYEILGYIHNMYRPIPGRLKDYIAVPKTNMYQSLHTTVIGDSGKIFEIQIRTEEMDQVAERGVAAHWRYKEGTRYNAKEEQKEIEDKLSWFKNFAAYSEEDARNESASEYMAMLQHDVFEANVYAMTPKGRVIDLPAGATPIDFAYRVHTQVGHECVGAIVNGTMVPLSTELQTGDVVSIKTRKGSGPSEDWLKVVKTNQARSKIKAYLSRKETERKEQRIPEGEKLLEDELKKRGFDAKEYMEKKRLEAVYHEFRVNNYTDFMYGIAVKSINPTNVCEKLTNQKRGVSESAALQHVLNRENTSPKRKTSESGVSVPGVEAMKISLARCCCPVYGDDIVGFITKGEGVKVHRRSCPSMNTPEAKKRQINVVWEETDKDRTYESDLLITANDRNYILTEIVNTVSQARTPIENINASVNHETLVTSIRLTLKVKDVSQLNTLMANLRKVESVISVERRTQ
jgi:guanosine-3',5'-bis(diphosphate) 3'-pyrophosphohydrolase